MNPMGSAWLNGAFYSIGWANQVLFKNDIDGNDLGQLNVGNHLPTAVASSPELGVLFILDEWNNRDLFVLNEEGQDVAQIGRDRYQRFQQGNWSRSLLWVDKHPDGQLWMNTPGHIWQMAVDVDNWDVTELVADFAPQVNDWAEEWDGLGHTKHDLSLERRAVSALPESKSLQSNTLKNTCHIWKIRDIVLYIYSSLKRQTWDFSHFQRSIS